MSGDEGKSCREGTNRKPWIEPGHNVSTRLTRQRFRRCGAEAGHGIGWLWGLRPIRIAGSVLNLAIGWPDSTQGVGIWESTSDRRGVRNRQLRFGGLDIGRGAP